MSDEGDWSAASFARNRLQQHRAFLALSFREKVERLEQMEELAAAFARGAEGRAADRCEGGSKEFGRDESGGTSRSD